MLVRERTDEPRLTDLEPPADAGVSSRSTEAQRRVAEILRAHNGGLPDILIARDYLRKSVQAGGQ
ncbi:MAG: hypothetical protein ACP5R5_12535 [Armatimonadota bacterium]